jgi:hypothetical protein
MKLTKQARGVLKALRSKQLEIPKVKSTNPPSKTLDNIFVVPDNPRALHQEQDQASTSAFASVSPTRRPLSRPGKPHAPRPAAGNSTGTILGKRPRHNMGNTAITIHEDEDAALRASGPPASTTSRTMAHHESDDEDSMADSISDNSDDSEDDIDESVIEDMRKLEESFKGISQKYRLINRIGEGASFLFYSPAVAP